MEINRRLACLMLASVAAGCKPAPKGPLPLSPPESVGFSAEGLKGIDAALNAYVDQGKLAGVATLVARHGKIVHTSVYGRADQTAGTPLKIDTIYRMASMTKPIAGVAMMMLFEEGKWTLDDPLTKFIPEFEGLKVKDATGKLVPLARPMLMRHIMSHTAGFDVNAAYVDSHFEAGNLQDMINKLAAMPLVAQPGEDWLYGPSVNIQGYIVEKLSGQTLGEFFQSRIFTPLKMVDTQFYVPQEKLSRVSAVHGYGPDGKITTVDWPVAVPTSPPKFEAGSGGLHSTMSDYWRFAQMVANGGEFEGTRYLKAETVQLMRTNVLKDGVYVDLYGPNQEGVGFGLDFAIIRDPVVAKTPQGKDSFYWGGAFGTWFWIDPTNDLVFIGFIQNRNGSRVAEGNPPVRATSLGPVYAALTDRSK